MLYDLVRERRRMIVTAECPSMDGGSVADLGAKIAGMAGVAATDGSAGIAGFVDAMNATDNPAAHAHASNLATAIALKQLGVEPLMQLVCRDKNRIALQADVAGAALFGITNFCALTGDDITAGDEPQARRVFDLDGPQLVSMLSSMGCGRYLSGRSFSPPGEFLVAAVENPAAPPLDYRAERALLKVDAGATLLQLQICYLPDRLENFMAATVANGAAARAAILPSVCLTRNARALGFMDAKVPGIHVPAEVIARVADAADPAEEAYLLVRDLAAHALSLPGVAGLHITDFRHDGSVARLVEELRIGPVHDPSIAPVEGLAHAHHG